MPNFQARIWKTMWKYKPMGTLERINKSMMNSCNVCHANCDLPKPEVFIIRK